MEKESSLSCSNKTRLRAASLTSERLRRQPGKEFVAFLQRLRIHPQAQSILGNACIPVVSLERLSCQSELSPSSLQPVVSLVRLPYRGRAKDRVGVACLDRPQQNGFSREEANQHLEIREVQRKPAESSDLSPTGPRPTSWTEPYCPDGHSSEPEQDSGLDCESNPDQPYVLLDSALDEWDPDGRADSETFYLDPDPEQTMVIELDPEPEADQDRSPELENETACDVVMVQVEGGEDGCSQEEAELPVQQPGPGPGSEEAELPVQQPGPGPGSEETESEDFCAVCLNGGDLLCCDRCPKVYHLACHIPPLSGFPLGDWMCTLCRTDQEPAGTYSSESMMSCGGVRAPYTLSNQDQRRCEKLTMLLYCHTLSGPFHEPVSLLARNYYQIIKRPINLSVIRRKLDKSNTLHYFTSEQFVVDVMLMLQNCATFNYPDSEVAQAGRSLEVFFLSKLREIFPDQTFPSASQDKTDRVRLRWLGRKNKENYRRKRCAFSGKKYYL